jgi:O-antigen ligase/Tfp pilus assembly protein PilF
MTPALSARPSTPEGKCCVALELLPRLALLALLFGMQLVFWQECQDPFNAVELAWIKILLPLAALPLLWRRWPGPKNLLRGWPARAAAAWMAWLWLAALFSPDRASALKNALEYSLYTLAFFLPALLGADERRKAFMAFFAACVLAAFYGFAQHFGFDPWKWSTNFGGRPLGTMGNPNFFGGHLVLAWGASLGLFITCLPPKRLRYGLLLLLFTLVQIYSRTVGVWLGMALAALALWLWALSAQGEALRAKWGLTRGRLLALAGVVLVLMLGAWLASRGKLETEKSASVTNRLMMWKVAVKLWSEKPLQGIGLTQYRREFAGVQAGILSTEKGWNYVVTWLPHENFLYLLCELGLIGFGLFCGAWALATSAARSRLKSLEPEAWAAALASFGMLGVSLLNTFSNIPPSALAMWFCLGLLAFPPRARMAPSGLGLRPALAVAAALSLILGYFAGREIHGQRLMREGLRKKKTGELQLSVNLLQKAADLDIKEFTPQQSVGIWYELAEVLRSGGALPQAAEAYKKDFANNPHSPEGRNMYGAALGQMGNTAESALQLREAIRLSPDYGAAMLNLGIAYATSNNLSGAAETWTKLLALEPNNQDAKNYLAQLAKMKVKKN